MMFPKNRRLRYYSLLRFFLVFLFSVAFVAPSLSLVVIPTSYKKYAATAAASSPSLSSSTRGRSSTTLSSPPSYSTLMTQRRQASTPESTTPSSSATPDVNVVVVGGGGSSELKQQHQQRMEQTAFNFIKEFESAWNQNDISQIIEFFIDEKSDNDKNVQQPFWRDMVAFTWNICTMEGKQSIQQGLEHVFSDKNNNNNYSDNKQSIKFQITSKPTSITIVQDRIEFWCDLIVPNVGKGKAHFRIVQQKQQLLQNGSNKYQIQTLLTTLMELHDRPFQIGHNRIRGAIHGPIKNRKYWEERLHEKHHNHHHSDYTNSGVEEDEDDEDYNYPIVIIGGGQAGLSLAARLQYMDIPYVVVEAGSKPGIAWQKRYPSLHLHDPVWYNHMPYLPFPETWPVLCPRNKIADWMEFYAQVLDLHVMTNQKVTSVTRRRSGNKNGSSNNSKEEGNEWIVQIQETNTDGDTDMPSKDKLTDNNIESSNKTNKKSTATTKTIRARHVVFATGNSSHPRIPKLPGRFKGVQIHSSQYHGGQKFANKKVVVVGSNNSAFDIVQDLWEQGAKSVTMIQRSPSLVVSTESVLKHGLGPLYREDAPLHHEDADLVATTMPYKMLLPRWSSVTATMRETDAKLHQGLIDAGYRMDFGPNGTGLFAKSATEGGGFYINMGSAELFIRGDVAIRYSTVASLQDDGVVIVDNDTEQEDVLPADVIVYATGFHTMDSWVADLCGEEISNKMGRTWGLGYGKRPHKDPGPWEGELRNMWKPTTVEGLWFHGGNLAQARHYSRFLALQLAARYICMKTPVHGIPNPTAPPPPTTP